MPPYDEWISKVRQIVLATLTEWGRADEVESCFNHPEGDKENHSDGHAAEEVAKWKLDAYDDWLNYGQYI